MELQIIKRETTGTGETFVILSSHSVSS